MNTKVIIGLGIVGLFILANKQAPKTTTIIRVRPPETESIPVVIDTASM